MLNKPTNTASQLLEATVNEITVAANNARARLAGRPSTAADAVVTAQQVQDEADAATWATLQVVLLAVDCKDMNSLAAAVKALTPAPVAAPASPQAGK